MKKVLFIFGTRPEIIKLAPVIKAADGEGLRAVVLHTGQHREIADEMLRLFQIHPDINLDVMRSNQTLFSLTSRILENFERVFNAEKYDMIVVQGDTTSAFLGALAGYYSKTPVAHVEAGLRSNDKFSPFPEEINRRLAGSLTDLHFPPTELSRKNLLKEGVNPKNIHVTGNTVIDALLWALKLPYEAPDALKPVFKSGKKIILVTSHRRESFGEPQRRVFKALLEIVEFVENSMVLFPVHPNPNVIKEVSEILKNHSRIHLCSPLGYLDFIHAMEKSELVLSDSGGVQEEAPSLKKPVLVLRDVTERPEGLDSGALKLVGTDDEKIFSEAVKLLTDKGAYAEMTKNPNPYGDGRASLRIIKSIKLFLDE
ncbi:MAG: UDP-N-acetylglucosamine 2-epimerase (non-hydrolyzing) [Candidatus Riflebacteria bacterium]|nr:UDP-N-acetylglucosamine 2-epimerase (non-hydrolyzing) [Candidatus Riflebacteria bacterium]